MDNDRPCVMNFRSLSTDILSLGQIPPFSFPFLFFFFIRSGNNFIAWNNVQARIVKRS